MSRRKSVDQLKESGTWPHMTKAEQERRLAAEAPPAAPAPGFPPMPQELTGKALELWTQFTTELAAARRLRTTDGPLLLLTIRVSMTGDEELRKRCQLVFQSRTPYADATPPPPPNASIPPVALATATQYAAALVSGEIVAGKFLKLAAKRFLTDLDRTDLKFDPDAAQHVVNYITRLGLNLLPWQVFVLSNLYGWKRLDGLRRFRYGFILVAKKNGKTALSGALGLYMSDPNGDGEAHADCFCAATSKAQSRDLCFKAALRLRDDNKHILDATHYSKSRVKLTWQSGSEFAPLAANSERLNGLNIHFGVLDELGDAPGPELHNVFTSSTIGRRQPLIVTITTAGEKREHISYEIRNRAAQVLDSTAGDDSFFAYIAELDEGDKPEDEAVWIKANPSLGILVPVENIRDRLKAAEAVPSEKRGVLRFHFNIWPTTSLESWIDLKHLDALVVGNETPRQRIAAAEARLVWKEYGDLSQLSDGELAALAATDPRRKCFGGLDLALVNDLSALCLLFPPSTKDGVWEALYRFWCPEENIIRRAKEQRVPYDSWRTNGYLIATPGEATDYAFIKGEILELRKKYKIVELGMDVAFGHDLARSLEMEGMKVTAVPQGFALSPGIFRLQQLVIAHHYTHFGHPIADWNFANVLLSFGFKGDARFERQKSREKIDGAVAAAIATMTAIKQANPVTAVKDSYDDKYRVRYI